MQEFDDASRGPWGSATLLLTINIRSLASVRALITILTLAYDPFVQQVLQYPARQIHQPNNETATTQALMWNPDTNTADFGNAVNAGIWSDETAFARNPSCPSGNCNWPTFRSMGWCSKCENITTRIELDDCPFEKYWDEEMSSLQCNLTFDGLPSIRYAWGQPEQTRTFDSRKNTTKYGTRQAATILTQLSWPIHSSDNNTGPTIIGIENPALAFAFVSLYYVSPHYSIINQKGGRIRPSVQRAEQCVLTPCARTYNISTVNGALQEEVVEENYGLLKLYTVKVMNNAASPFNTQDIFCWQPDPRNLTWEYLVPKGPTGACSGLYNPWIPNVAERWTDASGSGFCSLYDYQERLIAAINGTATQDASSMIPGEGQADLWEWLDANPYSDYGWSPEYSSPGLQKIKTTNLTTVVTSIAASLTKLGLDLSNVTVHGNLTTTEIYVQAEWKWLIFPMALEALGIILLVTTIVISHMQKMKLCKSSVMPLLYHGLGDNVALSQARPQDVFGMEELARKTKVKLGPADGCDRILLAA